MINEINLLSLVINNLIQFKQFSRDTVLVHKQLVLIQLNVSTHTQVYSVYFIKVIT